MRGRAWAAWRQLAVLLVAGCGGGSPASSDGSADGPADGPGSDAGSSTVSWEFDGTNWKASRTPPACPNPLRFTPPVDVPSVVAVLYPGQLRGGQYKPHGGFLFASGSNATVTVRAPMDGYVHGGVRYIQDGEVQYMFDFMNSCGVIHRLDHLLTLSARLMAIADGLPPAGASSATTRLPPGQHAVTEGEVVATGVGFLSIGNSTVDWGAYDLRQRNAASADAAWLAAHPGEQAAYALCWLDNLASAESAALRALPGGDGAMGKTSDYCGP